MFRVHGESPACMQRFSPLGGLQHVKQAAETTIPAMDSAEDFEVFFRDVYPRLVRSLWLLTADVPEAEDLAQETMARMLERWPKVRSMTARGGYAYRTALNLNRKRLRHLAVRMRRLPLAVPSPVASSDLHAEVAAALRGLPRILRETVLLVDWLGMGSEEASQVLGIRPSSVRSRVHRAHEVLRRELGGSDRG
jgi:RNA polymerase sigma-70 factor (ECF subfamily)